MSISNESEQSIRKPVPFWKKPPQVEFRPLFEALSKVAINAFSREWKDLAESVVDASAAIGLAQTTEEIGWLLVYRSLIQAMLSLLEENRANFYETPIEEDLKLLYGKLEDTLVSQASSINGDFFVNPKGLPILATIKTAFGDWLQCFIFNKVEVQTICDRLPTYFVFALHQEWAEHPDKYACLIAEVDTPFLKATERERSWMRYAAWLQKQIAEPIFRRIVQELIWIHKQLDKRQTDRYHRDGWDETEALRNWAILCGSSPIDNYLFDFICDEISLQDVADVEHWQKTLCHLIGYMLRHGMPMELLPEIKSFHQANQQARNAEEALLVVLNACARVTRKISQIEWPTREAFGSWISRLQGQRVSIDANVLCFNCLSFLDLKDCILITKDFFRANLEGANLEGANLEGANLVGAKLPADFEDNLS